MDFLTTIIIGIVEGLTEFLPISSTGHMILVADLLNFKGDVASAFEVFIQLGAILAVVVLYRDRFAKLLDFKQKEGFAGLRGCLFLMLTALPILCIGFVLKDYIKAYLFGPIPVIWALGIGGVIILLVERMHFKDEMDSLDQLTMKQALLIGLFQSLALWPGTSRAAATIIGGLFLGLNRRLAAEYSFLAAVPVMMVACTYDFLKIKDQLNSSDLVMFGVGFVVAFLSAIVAIKAFIHLLQRITLTPFALYRIAIAIVLFVLVQANVIGVTH